MIWDLFAIAFGNLLHRKKRSFLTIIGIFIGITAVVALISLGQGLSVAVNSEFEKIGKDKLIVFPGGVGMAALLTSAVLEKRDVDAIHKVNGIVGVAGIISKSVKVDSGKESQTLQVLGIPVDKTKTIVEQFFSLEPSSGRLFDSSDRYKCIVGNQLAKNDNVFVKGLKVGDTLGIKGFSCKVVGITTSSGDPMTERGVFIPISAAKEIFQTENYFRIIAKVGEGFVPGDLVEGVKEKLRKARDVKKDEEDFSVQTSENIVSSFNTIFGIIQAVVIGLAAISLLVGGIGIMNTMYTAVMERTREIGIMKAVGARNSEITTIFLIESGFLGLVGGIVGFLLGFGLSKLVEFIAVNFYENNLLQAYFPPELIIGSLLFSFVVGVASGVFPAMQAAKLKPVDSLRYE